MTEHTISRRGFVQAAGAFAGLGLLPSWREFRQRKQIDLTPFCADRNWRKWNLTQPFAQDGLSYGTDGSVLVRTTLADVPALGDAEKLPAASRLPWWGANDPKWQRWPQQQWFRDDSQFSDTCPVCWGRGCIGRTAMCSRCDGDGFLPCQEHEQGSSFSDWTDDGAGIFHRDCDGCQGSGYVSPDGHCDYCGGSGQTMRPCLQRIGSLVIAGEYDSRVRLLGDSEYAVVGNAGCGEQDGFVVRFRGDGFEGLLMPMFDRGVPAKSEFAKEFA